MKSFVIAIVMMMLGLVSMCQAAAWTTPDGQMTIQLPKGFAPYHNSEPTVLGAWGNDELTHQVIVLTEPYNNEWISTAALERNFGTGLPGAKFLPSSTSTINGMNAYTIAWTHDAEGRVFYGQAIFVPNGKQIYQLMILAADEDVSTITELTDVMKTLQITRAANYKVPPASPFDRTGRSASPASNSGGGSSVRDGAIIGAIAGGAIGLVIHLIKKRRNAA